MYGSTRFFPLFLLAALLSVATSGCDLFGGDDDDEGGGSSGISGSWAGDLETIDGVFTFTFDITDNGGTLSGDATVSDGGETEAISVRGTYSEPSVRLTFSDGNIELDFTGALLAGENFIVGTFEGVDTVFERQDGDGGGALPGGIGGIGGKRAPSGTLLESLKSTL